MDHRLIDISTEGNPGVFAIVDAADFEFLNQWKWHPNDRGYAVRTVIFDGVPYHRWMHRVVLDMPPDALIGDHINGNRVDNRRSNLRLANARQNSLNRSRNEKRARGVIYKGVYSNPNCATFTARIKVDGKAKYIGSFANQLDAALAYDAEARSHHGEFAKLNFPWGVVDAEGIEPSSTD